MGPPTDATSNWYDLLGLPVGAPDDEVAAAAEKLSRHAAALATTAPERSQQLRDTVRSIRADLLSGSAARAHYDARLASSPAAGPAASPPPQPPAAPPPFTAPASPPPQFSEPMPPSAPYAASASPSGPQNLIDSVVNGIGPAAARLRRFLQSGWTCPSCGADGGPADRFCSRCGAPMKEPTSQAPPAKSTCPACAATLATGHRFCSRCGTPVS